MTLKSLFDKSMAVLMLIVASPVLASVLVLVRWRLGSPVIFTQTRAGLHGEPFTMFKIRTMRDARDPSGAMLPDEDRLTPFGRLLRATSIDELPALANVLRGDMSLVGPRPLLVRYLNRYTPRQARRHEVKPGITGWAQVNGRNAITWDEKFELDLWYVENRSFVLDLWILTLTVVKVVTREGVRNPGHASMPEFFGSDHE